MMLENRKTAVYATLLFAFASSAFAETSFDETAWLRSTSLAEKSDCKSRILYRGVANGFLTLGQATKNMIGDELAELPSWRFSGILQEKYGGTPPSLEQWHEAKQIAEKELRERCAQIGDSCRDFGNKAVQETIRYGHQDGLRKQSFGIAATNQMEMACQYAAYDGTADNQAVCLQIEEQTCRAQLADGSSSKDAKKYQEFYYPIVIPHGDVTGAASMKYQLEKHRLKNGGVEILVHKIASNMNDLMKRPTPTFKHPGPVIARIVPCRTGGCKSQSFKNTDAELNDIATALDDEAKSGRFAYHLVLENPTTSDCGAENGLPGLQKDIEDKVRLIKRSQ